MTATLNDQASTDGTLPTGTPTEPALHASALPPGFTQNSHKPATHHPKAGLNPLADAASTLFTAIGKLKQIKACRQWVKLQQELTETVIVFQETIAKLGYHPEYIVVCRYIMCATIDDIINNTTWGSQGQWEPYALLPNLNQDASREDRFFSILDRAIQEPEHYIDLMELMYICLSLGYKGQYRATDHNQFQLEQITHSLYKHIRAYRGGFSKTLSPVPLKTPRGIRKPITPPSIPTWMILLMSVCFVMVLFISLGYLMEMTSNEAFKSIATLQPIISHETLA